MNFEVVCHGGRCFQGERPSTRHRLTYPDDLSKFFNEYQMTEYSRRQKSTKNIDLLNQDISQHCLRSQVICKSLTGYSSKGRKHGYLESFRLTHGPWNVRSYSKAIFSLIFAESPAGILTIVLFILFQFNLS